jgi:hypothetical protein
MMANQWIAFATRLLGLCGLAVGVLAHGGARATPDADRAAPGGVQVAAHDELERLEGIVPASQSQDNGAWNAHLLHGDEQLARGHIGLAVYVWHDAHGAALESHTWKGMIAVGDAFMQIGRAASAVGGARRTARDAYLTALIRARRTHSVDGVLRTAAAFQALGDRALVEQCLQVAAELATGDEKAQQRVHEFWQRWAAPRPNAAS